MAPASPTLVPSGFRVCVGDLLGDSPLSWVIKEKNEGQNVIFITHMGTKQISRVPHVIASNSVEGLHYITAR